MQGRQQQVQETNKQQVANEPETVGLGRGTNGQANVAKLKPTSYAPDIHRKVAFQGEQDVVHATHHRQRHLTSCLCMRAGTLWTPSYGHVNLTESLNLAAKMAHRLVYECMEQGRGNVGAIQETANIRSTRRT